MKDKIAIAGGIVMFILYISLICFKIWVIVEFVLYVFKDDPFNWNSLWFWIAAIVLIMACYIGLIASD